MQTNYNNNMRHSSIEMTNQMVVTMSRCPTAKGDWTNGYKQN